jgi:glycosyltransferase involved in cell wall biosynthesis
MAIKKPRVSIGVPVYNGEDFLEAALDSILAQTYREFELIISDNASTDHTQSICEHYAAHDPRIQYHRNHENRGAAQNYNFVFFLAVGDYFKWAAHDDLCAPQFLERCIEILDREPEVVLCYPKTILIDEHGVTIGDYADDLDLRSPFPHKRFGHYHKRYGEPAMCNPIFGLIRAETLRQTILIRSYPGSDMVLLGELALRGLLYEIPEPLFFRRDHPRASVRAHPGLGERALWFDPTNRDRSPFDGRKLLAEYLEIIRRVHMNRAEKVRCYGQMGGWLIRNRRELIKDYIAAIRRLSYKFPGPVRQVLRIFWRLLVAITHSLRIRGSNKAGAEEV